MSKRHTSYETGEADDFCEVLGLSFFLELVFVRSLFGVFCGSSIRNLASPIQFNFKLNSLSLNHHEPAQNVTDFFGSIVIVIRS